VSCSEQPDNAQQQVYETVRDINHLQLASATVTKTYTVRDPYYDDLERTNKSNDVLDMIQRSLHIIEHSVKIGERIGIYGLRREYAAFIDLNKISPSDISISEKDGVKHIELTLPPVEIKMLGNDFNTLIYHERTSGLRSDITEAERTLMRRKASQQMTADIDTNKSPELDALRHNATHKAMEFFTTMLVNLGYSPTINIKNAEQ
jgi:hypothetical protein